MVLAGSACATRLSGGSGYRVDRIDTLSFVLTLGGGCQLGITAIVAEN